MKNIILTGDRPTGKLHIGHYAGSLRKRVELQNSGKYDEIYIMIADAQAITDNFDNVQKIKDSIKEVCLDYLSVGLDPSKSTILIQSQIPELCELTFYYANLVSLSRLQRNPTVKNEIQLRGFQKSIPTGFLIYPISQAADITAFDGNVVPVGSDQLPMIEQTREIVRSFNSIYGETLIEPDAMVAKDSLSSRLPGTDGKEKMSKSLGNAIYISDSEEEIKRKVMSMFTDPNHLKVEDPGNVEGNPVFIYLEVFSNDAHFEQFLPEYKNLQELKDHYTRGGLGDMKVKKFLNHVMQENLRPIREKRAEYEKNIDYVYEVLKQGSLQAREKAAQTLSRVRNAMGLEYFKK